MLFSDPKLACKQIAKRISANPQSSRRLYKEERTCLRYRSYDWLADCPALAPPKKTDSAGSSREKATIEAIYNNRWSDSDNSSYESVYGP